MEGFILRLVFIGIGLVAGIIAYFGYGADGGKSRLEGLKDRTAPRGALPLPQMTPEFEQRYFRRIAHEKRGVLTSIFCGTLTFTVGRTSTFTFGYIFLLILACRGIANMADRTNELKISAYSAPRYARGRKTSLTDYIPLWALVPSMLISIAAFGVIFFITAEYTFTSWRPYVVLPITIGIFSTCWYGAARIASQPIYANSEADLRWEDQLISEDVFNMLSASTVIPFILIYGLYPEDQFGLRIILVFFGAYITAVTLLGIAAYTAQRRLWPDCRYQGAARQ